MLLWLETNLGTILVALVLIAIVALIVRKLIRDKRSGRSSCGCGCANCAMHGKCHK
jgi:flagellar biogenesis protein FliO